GIVSRSVCAVFIAVLTIASLVYGSLLGAFLLGIATRRANQRGVIAGMSASLIVMGLIWAAGNLPSMRQILPLSIAWTWYVLVGTIICFTVGYVVSLTSPVKATEGAEVFSK